MKKNKTSNFLIIAGLILIGIFYLSSQGVLPNINDAINSESKKTVVCDVTVRNLPLVSAKIKDVQCESSQKCPLFTTAPLSIFSDEVQLIFQAGGKSSTDSFKISESGDEKVQSLKLCVDDSVSSGKIKLIEKGEVIDQKDVSF